MFLSLELVVDASSLKRFFAGGLWLSGEAAGVGSTDDAFLDPLSSSRLLRASDVDDDNDFVKVVDDGGGVSIFGVLSPAGGAADEEGGLGDEVAGGKEGGGEGVLAGYGPRLATHIAVTISVQLLTSGSPWKAYFDTQVAPLFVKKFR